MLVSHSQLQVFRRCGREYFFRYHLGRYPLSSSAALKIGRSVHSAIGAHLRGEPWELEDPAQRAMMIGYIARWGAKGGDGLYTIERTDVPFVYTIGTIPCPACRGVGLSTCEMCEKQTSGLRSGVVTVEMHGEIDAVGYETSRPEEKAIFEHKTTSEDITPGSSYWHRVLMVDAQVSTYLRAGAIMGYKKVIYDVLRKPALRQKQKETPEEFCARIVEDIAERPDYYYQRATVIRLENEREDFVKDVLGTTRLMVVGEYPRNVDSCFKWNRPCDYFSVCSGEVGIDDDNRFQSRERKQPATATQPQAQPASGGSVAQSSDGEAKAPSATPSTVRSAEGGQKYVFGKDAKPDRS